MLNNLAWLYAESRKDLKKSTELASKAASLAPKSGAVLDTLGWIYMKRGMVNEAKDQFEKAISFMPNNPEIHFHLGKAFQKLGETARAKKSFEKSLELSQDFTGAEEARKFLKNN